MAQKFNSAAGSVGSAWESTRPARSADVRSDFLLPALQATFTGALVAGVVAFVVWRSGDGDAGGVFVGVALVATLLVWVVLLGQHRRLMWAVERVLSQDVNRDGAIGEPQERIVLVNGGQGQAAARATARQSWASGLAHFVARVPARGSSLRDWEGELSRDAYIEYRDALLGAGLAAWRSFKSNGKPNERQGWELVGSVDDVLARIGG